MNTYNLVETLEEFTLLRPVFLTLLIVLLIIFLVVITPTLRVVIVNTLALVGVFIISPITATQLLFYDAVLPP